MVASDTASLQAAEQDDTRADGSRGGGPVPWPLAVGVSIAVVVVSLLGGTVGLVAGLIVAAAALVVARRAETVPATWAAGTVAAGCAVAQTTFAGHTTYLTEAVDSSYGWSGLLLLLYTFPVVVVTAAVWAGMRLRRAGRSRWWVAAACVGAVVWASASVWVGSAVGNAVGEAAVAAGPDGAWWGRWLPGWV